MIEVEKTALLDLLVVKPTILEDHRGTFLDIYYLDGYLENGVDVQFVRDAISTSTKNVLRGIHYDDKTWNVVVDMRQESPTYLQWESFTLTDQDRLQVLVPPQFGNGHLVLSDQCIFHYKMSEYYDPAEEKILKWDDPRANIDWPVKKPILSVKDSLGYNPDLQKKK
jgi:dTDP-4-dehydrorhamnose 3,5-epimerase